MSLVAKADAIRRELGLPQDMAAARRSEIEFSVSMPPPGRSEGPGPLHRKQKHVSVTAVTRRFTPQTGGGDPVASIESLCSPTLAWI